VLVERVERLTAPADWKRAYREINEFERLLTDDGMPVIKLFLHVSPDEQLRRFRERIETPYKRWKITEDDFRNRARRSDYVRAVDDMLAKPRRRARRGASCRQITNGTAGSPACAASPSGSRAASIWNRRSRRANCSSCSPRRKAETPVKAPLPAA
jgi:hypothetical protein